MFLCTHFFVVVFLLFFLVQLILFLVVFLIALNFEIYGCLNNVLLINTIQIKFYILFEIPRANSATDFHLIFFLNYYVYSSVLMYSN